MPQIPTRTIAFPHGNPWAITDGAADIHLSLPRLLHAAITVGHDHGWRQVVGAEIGGQMELLWKKTAFLTTVHEANIARWGQNVSSLLPTERFGKMDPSERRALTYHLGMTMAAAWTRHQLKVPWLLHLDVYRDQLDPTLQPGDSRPDLVGRHADGRWVVLECKGGSTGPTRKAQTKAKRQAQRIIGIGGVPPSLALATFAFFATDKRASRPKPKVVTMWIFDPPSEGRTDNSISLSKLTDNEFFRLYYQPWQFLFEKSFMLDHQGPFVWRHLRDLDLSIGILTDLKKALDGSEFAIAPRIVQEAEEQFNLASEYPDWIGDGIVLKPGGLWSKGAI
jgi:hypothetical protein